MPKIQIDLSLSELGGYSIEIDGKSYENVSSTIAEDLVMCALLLAEDSLLQAPGLERESLD